MVRIHPLGDRGLPRYEVLFHPAAEKEFLVLPGQVQSRFERAIDLLAVDPLRPRPGADIKKLGDLGSGEILCRLRVGEHRSCYAVVTARREVLILLFDARGAGYDRIIATAKSRRRGPQ